MKYNKCEKDFTFLTIEKRNKTNTQGKSGDENIYIENISVLYIHVKNIIFQKKMVEQFK